MIKIICLQITTLLFLLNIGHANTELDKYAKLGARLSITNESDSWIKISVPFNLLTTPRLAQIGASRPTTLEGAFNPEYANNVRVKLYLCFTNEFKKKALRSSRLPDTSFFQYYSAEQVFETIKLDRNTINANFLFPTAIADRDGFGGGYVTPTGYAVEISIDGTPLEISNSIVFDKHRDISILLKFKEQAVQKSNLNSNILIPAHHVYPNYYLKGAHLKLGL